MQFTGEEIRKARAANIYSSYAQVETFKKSRKDNIIKSNTFLSPQLVEAIGEDEFYSELLLNVKKNTDASGWRTAITKNELFKSQEEDLSEVGKAFEELEKGEVFDALTSSNGGDDRTLIFSKTGKEVKEKMEAFRTELQTVRVDLVTKMAALEQTIGTAPDSERISYSVKTIKTKKYSWQAYNSIPVSETPSYMPMPKSDPVYDAQRKAMDQYNDLSYELEKVDEDLEAIRIADANIEEGKSYKFNIRQLSALGF